MASDQTKKSISLPLYETARAAMESTTKREHEREMECMARAGGGCLLVSMDLGWKVPLPIQDCDACVAAGGLDGSRKSRKVRARFIRSLLGRAIARGGRNPREVLVALTVKHGMGKMVARWLASGEERQEDERRAWARVRFSWATALSFSRSVLSVAGEPLPEWARRARRRSCFGGEGREACPSLRRGINGRAVCGACGCGDTSLAALEGDEGEFAKLDFPWLECPRGRPGFHAPGVGLVPDDVRSEGGEDPVGG